MSPVELWRSNRFAQSKYIDDWAEVFSSPKNLILTENQEERDYLWSMQMVFGCEVRIEPYNPDIGLRTYRMKTSPGCVYLTWDPADRNRI